MIVLRRALKARKLTNCGWAKCSNRTPASLVRAKIDFAPNKCAKALLSCA